MLPVWGGIYSELNFLFVLRKVFFSNLLGENWKLKIAGNRKLKKISSYEGPVPIPEASILICVIKFV